MLGARGKPFLSERDSYETPGFGGSMPVPRGMPDLSAIPPADRVKLGFADKGGLGSRLLDGLDAFITTLGAARGNPMQLQMLQQRAAAQRQEQDDARAEQRYQQQFEAQQAQANRPQIVNGGNGGYTIVNPADGSIISERAPAPEQGETERLIAAYATLPDGDPRRPLIERAIRGYQYTAPVMQAQTAAKVEAAAGAAAARGEEARRTKATPTYANMNPRPRGGGGGGGITPTARARYMAEAEAAISRGAPRAAVMARLAKMGVQ